MIFLGIQSNRDKTFTVSQMDQNRNIISISNFWKEGLLWFLDHANPSIVSVNFSEWFDSTQSKNAYEVISKLVELFDFEEAEESINRTEKLVIKTDADLFFKQLVKKDLLSIKTREGIEQRLYNLPKAGIIVKHEILSKEKDYLQREITAIATSFAAYSIHHNQFKIEEREGNRLFIPVYRFVPKDKRIISNR
ncbi:hypothetical protein SAMN06265182_0708 [Persephonella hydrogeniphila]|uniref:Uncharacterized protein n=1 Tax=Persephonella hydrogeniphila TaxID=198703 RepID=A0A285NB40_9AQUI|nr:hypothetical protein [Persephonella hydrogeniphila]SNZ06528.1 hypothetical protein SAMN06265182_0708 [Persephonella hydrogeniphila]